MTEVLKINTSKYTKSGKVDIDGNIWTVNLPGAGTELRFSQASRAAKLYGSRIALLDRKIDSETITEAELDNYEEYSKKYEENEGILYAVFQQTFDDGTPDNKTVKKWIDETPTAIIMMSFEDVKNKAEGAVTADEEVKIEKTDGGEKATPATE